MAGILPNGSTVFLDNDGVPLASGTVAFFVPNTSLGTPKDTWQDRDLSILNDNPLTLDSAGRALIWGIGFYETVVKDADGNVIWDAITGAPSSNFYNGGTTTGSENAQALASVEPAGFALGAGTAVSAVAGFTNTGATTLNVESTGARNVYKQSAAGPVPLDGGELVAGQAFLVIDDGTQWELYGALSFTAEGGVEINGNVIRALEAVNAQSGTTYTFTADDRAKFVTFANAGAVAVVLPQATGNFASGWFVDASCLSSSVGSVTITPATSTIDGAATLVLTPGQSVRIVSDETGNYQVERGLGLFTRSYDSGNQTITAAGSLTLAHGLGRAPTVYTLFLHCLSAEGGFTSGQEALINPSEQDVEGGGGAARGCQIVADATNINVRFGSGASTFGLFNFSSGAFLDIDNTKWALVVRAYA